ncbi:hypothetical protein KLP28_01185 [Nocardioidaceae bacterium]|nr:hypothetical protein KLP28_01185 [Nocardioidaceae bacterium]
MAKALHGYLVGTDAREQARLLAENRRLRQRVRDLETQLLAVLEAGDAATATTTPTTTATAPASTATTRTGLAPV